MASHFSKKIALLFVCVYKSGKEIDCVTVLITLQNPNLELDLHYTAKL